MQDQLSLTFAALADPTRRAILDQLGGGEASVVELTGSFQLTQQAVSKHLKVLERAGLITRGRVGQSRPCRVRGQPLGTAADWIERHRQLWDDRYDRLDVHLADLQERPAVDRSAPAHPTEETT
jgi:DNA-binding transcriptional ArsR family regulator